MIYKGLHNFRILGTILVISAFFLFSFAGSSEACYREIHVTTYIEEATFTIYKVNENGEYDPDISYLGGGTYWSVGPLLHGTYEIVFDDVEGYITPPSVQVTLIRWDNDRQDVIGNYEAEPEYKYGINMAAGDIDGDGVDEIIIGKGPHPNVGDEVRIINEDGEILYEFNAGTYDNYGVNVAAGDIDGDGIDEIITGSGPGPDNNAAVQSFDAYGEEGAYFDNVLHLDYGANVAVGDLGL
jgi:hypothetical protein